MKLICLIACSVFIIFGCNDESSSSTVAANEDSTAVQLDYPYKLEQPYKEWRPGDQQHAINVMKSLKAYENGDMESCIVAFGDTVDLKFDGFHARLAKDSLKKMFTQSRENLAAVQVKMGDWESVISKDKQHEYVTLWYKEIQTDKKGKTDSLSIVDDVKIVNGKIVELDQKIQHFPAAKKM